MTDGPGGPSAQGLKDQQEKQHADLPRIDATIGPKAIRTLRELLLGNVLPQVYVTSGQITAVERVSGTAGADAGDEDAPLPVAATTMTAPTLAHLLAQHTYTYRHAPKGAIEEFTPPREVLSAALAPREWPGVRPLHGIIGAPVLRRDGTLLQEPGYDPATGLYLAPTVQLDPIPAKPTAEQVEEARAFLVERFLVDFPWTSKADRANYLALMVSPALRPFLRCLTPFGIITATMPGSGKTILTAAIGLLYGQRVLSWPDADEELRKSITAVMAEPVGAVVFDNLAEGAVIDSPILARLITEHTWSDRRLGSSANVAYPNDRLWLATGNNLAVGGDMASRTMLVRLDPDMPHPEERSGFTIPDLPAWIMAQANRRTLLRHVLTLVVDWCANGAPAADSVTMRQFTPWARAVGGFLAHHGIEGFLTNIDQVRAVDESDEEWTAFLARWWQLRKDTPILANELLASAQIVMTDEDIWQGAFITGRNGRVPNAKSLGWMLRGQTGRWHGDFVLRTDRGGRAGDRRTWHVEHATSHTASANQRGGEQDEADTARWGEQEELPTNGWPPGSIGALEAQAAAREARWSTHP
ncbi:MAG TPA: hypothetical protein VGS97_05050 [Actinocrinis sp.]|uniref:hypothetical protein n=1 Tax=Actinocrinis sp. TaxID=1920516 RepID=UPI002DDDA919|nr:hypothetical protein [Actinocrinis sp.]HEV2343440.1 hypothetical protein [Actinocrinis sp.]